MIDNFVKRHLENVHSFPHTWTFFKGMSNMILLLQNIKKFKEKHLKIWCLTSHPHAIVFKIGGNFL